MAFQNVAGLNPQYSVFDNGYEEKFDGDMGILYPISCHYVMPGDVFDISEQTIVRFHQSLFTPLLHEVNLFTHTFFVPLRILWRDGRIYYGRKTFDEHTNGSLGNLSSWEDFLSGGIDGTEIFIEPKCTIFEEDASHFLKRQGSVIDFLYGVDNFGPVTGIEQPLNYPLQAYYYIFNEYYRDQNLQEEKRPPTDESEEFQHNGLLYRNWEKDYFTASLPWRQKGIAPGMPISIEGMLQATFNGPNLGAGSNILYAGNDPSNPTIGNSTVPQANQVLNNWLTNYNNIDASQIQAFSFNTADLTVMIQAQKWLERNARGGTRYTELLRSHWGKWPRDERLDRPEYIGGKKTPVIFSEVLQTSETGESPLGSYAGHGLSADQSYVGRYHVQENGIIMTILSVMPRTQYQQGVNRQWLRDDKYDHPWPEFMHLREQPIYEQEIMLHATSEGTNREVFGYQGRYDEFRYIPNRIIGKMKDQLKTWHLSRIFSTVVEDRPMLNEKFVSAKDIRKDYLPAMNEPAFICSHNAQIKAVRPLPFVAEPGLIDHF